MKCIVAPKFSDVSWPGFPLILTFSVSGKMRYLNTSLKRCVSKSMYVRILCDLTRMRIRTLLAHCCIYDMGHLCCLKLFHKYCFITNIRGELEVLVISRYSRNSKGYQWIVNGTRRTRWLCCLIKIIISHGTWKIQYPLFNGYLAFLWTIRFPSLPWIYRLHPPFYSL